MHPLLTIYRVSFREYALSLTEQTWRPCEKTENIGLVYKSKVVVALPSVSVSL